MKKILTITLLCLVCYNYGSFAQGIVLPPAPFDSLYNMPGTTLAQLLDTLQSRLNPADTGEGGGMDRFEELKQFWQSRVSVNDSSGHNMFFQYFRALKTDLAAGEMNPCAGSGTFQGDWTVLGPNSLGIQAVGKVDVIWVDPTDSTKLLAATMGGLFQSTNAGANWKCITDDAPIAGGVTGITGIAVNPLNKQTIYLGTSTPNAFDPAGWGPGGAAILKSFDGGAHWQQEFVTAGTPTLVDSIAGVQKVFFTPDSSRLYAFMGNRIFTRYNIGTGNLWTEITPAGISSHTTWNNLQFVPGNKSHFFVSSYAVDEAPTAGVWESTVSVPSSTAWNHITSGLSGTFEGSFVPSYNWLIMDISIPTSSTLYFVALGPNLATSGRTGVAGLFSYNFTAPTPTITTINSSLPHDINPTGTKLELIVSPSNTNNIYFGSDVPYQSCDGGITFTQIAAYDPTDGIGNSHGDVRFLYLQQATTSTHGINDRLYMATDGGVSEKPAGVDVTVHTTQSSIDITGVGLSCGEFHGIATSPGKDLAVGGMQHDGVFTYETDQTPQWLDVDFEDAYSSVFVRTNALTAYGWGGYPAPGSMYVTSPAGGRLEGTVSVPVEPDGEKVPSPLMATDNFGDIYSGNQHLWLKTPTTTSYSQVALGLPSSVPDGDYIIDLALSPNYNTPVGCVLYNDQKLFYRGAIGFFATHTTTPGAPSYFPVSCVTIDAQHPGKLWVGQGAVNFSNGSPTQLRAQYSPDGGTTWIDISNGLPQHVPVSHITFDEAENVLFCSTDVGIFRCDFNTFNPSATIVSGGLNINTSVVWTCFNQGLVSGTHFPNAFVTELQINHCEGKLYASTYGRAVWSSDLTDVVQPIQTDTISGSVTWTNSNQYISGGIYIKAGATLTLNTNDTLHMPKNGVISVEKGGKLAVHQSMITNDCDQCFWKGIEAHGQSTSTQIPANQAWVIIDNGSTIQHAKVAVTNWDKTDSATYGYATTGGIIQISNSTLINNQVGVALLPYHNHTAAGVPMVNIDYFYQDVFSIDGNYKGDNISFPFLYHAYLNGVEGVKFTDCQFLNRDLSTVSKGMGIGIYSFNGGFNVMPYCGVLAYTGCPSPQRSRFCGLLNGIFVEGDPDLELTKGIDEADFDTVSIGVYISAVNNVSFTRNNFNIGHGLPVYDLNTGTFTTCHQNMGVFIQNTAQFRNEGNDFEGKTNLYSYSDWQNIGVAAVNTGGSNVTVYRNTFNNLTEGVYALGCNRGLLSFTMLATSNDGLQIRCNTFTNNVNDIAVTPIDGGAGSQGIAQLQGSPTVPSGNTFSGSTNNINDNAVSPLKYYYHSGSSSENPTHVSSIVNVTAISGVDSCPSSYSLFISTSTSATGLSGAGITSHKTAFNHDKLVWQDSLAVLNHKLDFGNSDSLAHIIKITTDTNALFSILNHGLPYLSERILECIAIDSALPHNKFMTILTANPEALRDYVLLDSIDFYDRKITVQDLPTLKAASHSSTSRSALEGAVNDAKWNMDNESNIINMAMKTAADSGRSVSDTTGAGICLDSNSIYFRTDSNSCYYYVGASYDSVDKWLQNNGNLWTYYARCGLYFSRGDTTSVKNTLHTVSLMARTSEDTIAYNYYLFLHNLLRGAYAGGRNVLQLNGGEISSLNNYYTDSFIYNTGQQLMRAVIHVTTTTMGPAPGPMRMPCLTAYPHFPNRQSDPDGNGDTAVIQPVNTLRPNSSLAVYPNPTSGMVNFIYDVPDANGNIHLIVTNVTGEKVGEEYLTAKQGTLTWNSANYSSGIYLYQISDINGEIGVGKIIVTK